MSELFKTASSRLRKILEEKADKIASAGCMCFQNFPVGCCDTATNFLAHYLVKEGLCDETDILMPWNNYDNEDEWCGTSHCWILLENGLKIDITADQFEGVNESVIVASDHPVHKRFVGEEWVSFKEHHRRVICFDSGESFNRAWSIISENQPIK